MSPPIADISQDLVVLGVVPMTWLAYAVEIGLPVQEIVDEAGLATEQAASFSAGISLRKFQRLMMAIYTATGDAGVGFEVGWRMPPTTFGNLGHALMASPTIGSALTLCQRFWPLIARDIALDVAFHDTRGVITISPQFPHEGPLRRIVPESIMTSLYRGIVLLAPEATSKLEVWFNYPEPPDSERLREKMPSVRFGMPLVQVRFPVALLDIPLPMASAAGLLAAIQQCEVEERMLNLEGALTARVQKELGYRASGYPTLAQVAGLLSMAERTLRRRLQEEGTSYSVLLDTARLRDAIVLLENPNLDIVQVATYLGYHDAANFTRAFRKWTGTTPSQFRADLGKI